MNTVLAWLAQRLRQRADSEHGQALVRIALIALILCYVLLFARETGLSGTQYRNVLAIILGGQALSIVLFAWLLALPGRSDPRRVAGMLADYGLIAAGMIQLGEPLAWVYIVVMWVTVGNGMRYGNNYLYAAVAMALLSFGVTLAASEYWQHNLRLGLGLLLGLAAVPLYFSSLLRQLTEATAEARRASDAKSRFLANMSHEFRTPLNGLSGMTELLAGTALDREQRECVDTIQASTRTLLGLVEEVLDISAIEAGKLRVQAADFSLSELFHSIGLILAPQARAKQLDYRVFVETGVPDVVHGDAGHLRQVLLNLAGNAVKFTERGHVEIRVAANRVAGQLQLRFEVLDTGIGVPASLRPRLFDPFEQADASLARRHEGSGLGTAIAKGLVQAMGGTIGYRENQPAGSCFWVELPLQAGRQPSGSTGDAAAASAPAQELAGNVIAFDDPFLRHRARVRSLDILVVDDHEANRMVLQRLLQKAGHKVSCVPGAEQALDAMAAHEFDVAITDLHMPGLSGLDMLKQLRVMQAGGGPRTPVVIFSADVTAEAIERCRQAGAHAFMAKPVVASRLLETMADIAGGAAVGKDMAAVVAALPVADAVLDTGVLDELASLGIGKEFEQEFVRQCLQDLDAGVAALPSVAAAGDWDKLREHAHAIKGVAANLGLPKVVRQGGEMMRMADWQLRSEWRARVAGIGQALEEGRLALHARARGHAQSRDDNAS